MTEERKLTDADVEAIVTELKAQLVEDFEREVGRGFWAWIKKALFLVLLLLAVQGMMGDKAWLHQLVSQRAG